MTGVAFHVDQLFYPAPGGIGTYVRHLVPALAAQYPSLEIKLFHARFDDAGLKAQVPERWMREFWMEELPHRIRTLYPRWAVTARPHLPQALSSLDLVHAPSPAAVPPAGSKQRLVVTVHDLAFLTTPSVFPLAWRSQFRLGLRAALRRAHSIITPSRNTAEDLLSRTEVDPSKVHVIPLAASTDVTSPDPEQILTRLKIPRPYLLYVGTLEPRKNLVRLVRAYRRAATSGLPHALVLAGLQRVLT